MDSGPANQLTTLEDMVHTALTNESNPTGVRIRDMLRDLSRLTIFDGVTESDIEFVAKKLEERVNIAQHVGSILTRRDHQPWLEAAKSKIDPYFWNRYSRYLTQTGFPGQARAALDAVTDRVLGQLSDPASQGSWDRRGLVIGYVQSGKTANYTGLVCKAADAGYRLIIIIAGIHNNLRAQTQRRIDLGFIGRDSSRFLSGQGDLLIGVGQIDRTRRPVTFTNTVRDFNRNTASAVGVSIADLRQPAVFVVKKNHSTLRNLIDWLSQHSGVGGTSKIDVPMLLIDDEADNASINIRKGAGEVSRINGQLRQLLTIFTKSCYVGYTATPFANIFIEPDSDDQMFGEDLFPRSFIVSLDPPSNYFGATSVFTGGDSTNHLRYIDDNEDHIPIRHPKDFVVGSLPPSLVDATRAFVIAKSIRLARRQDRQHNSMLVNVSRFIDIQGQLRNQLHDELGRIKNSIRFNFALDSNSALRDPEMRRLYEVWEKEYRNSDVAWESVQEHLNEAASPIVVAEVNSRSSSALNYQDHGDFGLNLIAVGGFSLSRGLTLEGLMVSYFLRNSMMYDTLMQMGRWFGYRDGYRDLCRVWMPEEAAGWYEHISDSIEELRTEIRAMEAANATPRDFGLKIRSHPDALIVTARNKLGSGANVTVSIGLSNRLIETHTLLRDEGSLTANRLAARRLAASLVQPENSSQRDRRTQMGRLICGASVDVILQFLVEFRNHEASFITDGDPVRRYIESRSSSELKDWDVLFISTRRGELDHSLGFPLRCQVRTAGRRPDAGTLRIGNRQRVSSRGIEKAGLTEVQIEAAERDHRESMRQNGRPFDGTVHYPDHVYRGHRARPLLMIHLIHMQKRDGAALFCDPVVAWGISFPKTRMEEKRVEYVANLTWLKENYESDFDDEEMDGDEV